MENLSTNFMRITGNENLIICKVWCAAIFVLYYPMPPFRFCRPFNISLIKILSNAGDKQVPFLHFYYSKKLHSQFHLRHHISLYGVFMTIKYVITFLASVVIVFYSFLIVNIVDIAASWCEITKLFSYYKIFI